MMMVYELPCMLELIQLQLASASADSTNCRVNIFKEHAQILFLSLLPKYSKTTAYAAFAQYLQFIT